MKAGRNLNDIMSELEAQEASKRDFTAPAARLGISDTPGDFALVLRRQSGDEAFPILDTAHQQLAESYDIPRPYYERMRRTAPELFRRSLEHWFGVTDRKHLIRTLGGEVRAVLSHRYRPLDHLDLYRAAWPVLEERGFELVSAEVTEKRFYLKAVTPLISGEVRPGDKVQAGIVLSNSETGHGSLCVEPLFYFLACTNGLMLPDARFKRAHVGKLSAGFETAEEFVRPETRALEDAALWSRVRDVVTGAMDHLYFHDKLRRFRAAREDRLVGWPSDVVEVTATRFRLTEEERDRVLGHLLGGHAGEPEFTRYGLAQAVSRTGQQFASYERATELEQLSGHIIELSPAQWEPIAEGRAA
jgi:hypothetical protein